DLGAEDVVELLVGLVGEQRIGEDPSSVDDAVDWAPGVPDRVDALAHGPRAAHVDRVVAHLRTRASERGDVSANLAAIEDQLGGARQLLRIRWQSRGGRAGQERASELSVRTRVARLGRLVDEGGATEERELRAVLAKGCERRGRDPASAARHDEDGAG